MANSTSGVDNCGSFQALMNSNNGIEYLVHQDTTKNQCYQSQLANLLSHEGSGTEYQSLDRDMDIELANANGFEDHLYGEPDPIPLEKFLSGIEQEVFLNHPWFKHNEN